MRVRQLLSTGQMDHRTAGLMLYALQTASVNLRNTEFEAEEATDVVIDRDTVHLTSIGGPQWFEEDFEDEAEEDEVGVAAGSREGATEPEAVPEEAGVEAHAQQSPERVRIDEARRRVQRVVVDWALETVKAEAASRG
jgi:hypothetical protein